MDKPEILPTTISLGIKKKYTAAETINIPKVIIEKSLMNIMFELPSRQDISKVILTKESVLEGKDPKLVFKTNNK